MNPIKPLRNQSGMMTVDFIFSLVLICGFACLMFVLAISLSMASVTQYITFAAARNYEAAHIDQTTQEDRGSSKFKELVENPVFKPLFESGWYKVEEPNVGDHTNVIPEFGSAAGDANKFWGVGTMFTAAVLDINIPFFGSTAPDGDGSGDGFQAYIGSYLGREPTTEECLQFTDARWNKIKSLSSGYGSASGSQYYPQADDGC